MKITVNSWTDSQQCISCIHGEFIQSITTFLNSDYICHKDIELFGDVCSQRKDIDVNRDIHEPDKIVKQDHDTNL
jgi:hypothetical protein